MRRRRVESREDEELTESLLRPHERESDEEDEEIRKPDEGPKLSEEERNRLAAILNAILLESWNCVLALLAFLLPGSRAPFTPNETQEKRLDQLERNVKVPYDGNNKEHLEHLETLWEVAFPNDAWTGVKSPKWKDMGWQGEDPGTDFRGGGVFALMNLLYLANKKAALFHSLLNKTEGQRSDWEYPFAAVGVNITFNLIDSFKLRDRGGGLDKAHQRGFVKLLDTSEDVFEEIYCMAFELLDKVWLDMKASYMEFPSVMKRTRNAIEEALSKQPTDLLELRRLLALF